MKRNIGTLIAMVAIVALASPVSAQWTQNVDTVYTNGGINFVGVGTTTPAPYGISLFKSGTNAFFGVKSTTGLAGFIMDRGSSSVASSLNFRTAGADTWIAGIGAYAPGSDFQIGNAVSARLTLTPAGNLSVIGSI